MKNIVLCVDLDQDSIDTLKKSKDEIAFKHNKIHLIHVFPIHVYNSDLIPFIYPVAEQYPEIENSTKKILVKMAEDLGIPRENLVVECFFARSRQDQIKTYLSAKNADLVVLATKGKHGIEGFFYSSLTEFLCKYSPCDVLVLRPKS